MRSARLKTTPMSCSTMTSVLPSVTLRMSCHSFARTLMDETGSCAGGRWRGLFQESCHSFARTLMDETGYCAGGRWRGRLPLGVLSPRMSLIGRSRRTLDCRHGEAVLAVAPGARRREYPFLVRRAGRLVLRGSAMETLHRRC